MEAGRLSDEPKSFLEHLEELRHTIVWSVSMYGVCFLCACFTAPRVIKFLQGPLLSQERVVDPEKFLMSINLSEPFMVWMRVALWTGLLFSLPFIVFVVGHFIVPGLTKRERGVVRVALGASTLLFAFGVWMCYSFTLPLALGVMLWIPERLGLTVPGWTIGSYTVFVLRLLVAFGLAFQLPVVVYSLGSLGIITSLQMRDKRRHVIVGLLVLAMILTPSDPWTMLMMAVPLVLLYEACIWLIRLKEIRKRAKSFNDDGDAC